MMIKSITASALLIMATTTINAQKITYPQVVQDDVVENYFGTKVSDPYRWLEDENSSATKNFVEQQRAVTNAYLNKIPFRDQLKTQLADLWDYETMGAPSKHGNYYVLSENDGKQNQAVTYIKNGKDGKEEVFIDPNTLSSDGTTSISNLSFSKDNKYAAYMISKSGSDWKDIVVLEVATKTYLKDTIRWSKFSGISWYNNGFYYSGYAIPEEGKEFSNKNEFHTVFYHELGKAQKEDNIIFKDEKNPLKSHYCGITEDGRFLAISGSKGTSGNNLIVKDLSKKDSEFITLIDDFDNDSYLIDNMGDSLLIFTNYQAPNNRIAITTLAAPLSENWTDFIAEKDYVLESVSIVGNKLFATYLKDVQSKIEIYKLNGTYLKDLALPGIGICYGVSGKKGEDEAYYSFTSFINPTTTYQLKISDLKSTLYFKPKTNFNSDDFVTEQVFYKSKDGTKIPMFISYKKGLKMDSSNPTLLYGYGGFNISYKPSFDVAKSVFMMNGGVYAVANLRGGSEYGEKWHKAGMLNNKQNVFDDFINAANYLKDEKYTSTEKLAIHGRSNGGLLVGAVMTQQPNIAKVALPMVGVLDMLRYHKFTIGWAWAVEYGNSEDKASFENLIKYSPLHNVKPASYPATLILTADHDDRVVPAHSFKFAAELQKQQQGDNPTLIRIDTKSGHGSGKPKSKLIEEWADIWAFTFYNLGVTLK
jgi:prolyl oligopeptidase